MKEIRLKAKRTQIEFSSREIAQGELSDLGRDAGFHTNHANA
ncbi:MAG: hypothetical protein P8Z00_10830 [Anaerolineales bacterium]|jgi:hypothetical protein